MDFELFRAPLSDKAVTSIFWASGISTLSNIFSKLFFIKFNQYSPYLSNFYDHHMVRSSSQDGQDGHDSYDGQNERSTTDEFTNDDESIKLELP
ncbi:17207_t:CDS:2 [Cetraspora pellucida]|uniref:17207_t:CDS:1 n=1 Tax=Cetraspora pellucida TaxID=1433469 RepID=A0A9N9AS83_9GLOM|nr:17207_t:CDS:2 [Cetraspora pellucida]